MIDGSMNATSGGSDAGWHVEVADNPEMTHQAYIDALTEWRAEQQAASGRRPDDG
jgi:hypothetical protein